MGSARLTQATVEFLERSDSARRKRLGQYFTPEPIRRALVARMGLAPGMRVLDPGAGTGEFLLTCAELCPGLDLHGWDVDAGALAVARRLVPAATLTKRDALRGGAERFDAIVGNPPYFELRGRPELRRAFASVIGGRANVFALFVHVGLSLLERGGMLGFVVPPSMNNGAYFENLRRHIVSQASIEHLEILGGSDHFDAAQQAVQLLVLRKGGIGDRYQFERALGLPGRPGARRRLIFTPDPARLRKLFLGRRTLFELGYEAVTGTIVWNQHRKNLRSAPERGAVPLIWAHNIADGAVELDASHRRPQYVVTNDRLRGPAIVVNRITGSVGDGELRAALIARPFEFVGENHVNVIRRRVGARPLIGWRRLLAALREPGVQERVRALTGNTQISATELTHVLPLYG
jgi:adenine-specific DNA-methyltransferase